MADGANTARPLVLVVEDEAALATMLRYNLEKQGFRVEEAGDGQEALTRIAETTPDLVLLDWMLPGGSGLELLKRWRANPRTRELPLIMLTARADETDKVAGLDAGADDYLAKPFSPRELLARMRAVLRRRAGPDGDAALQAGGLCLDPAAHRLSFEGPSGRTEIKLGPTEFRLLHHLMRQPERVHSRSQLLDHVWGLQAEIAERTVDVHVKRLREALAPLGCERLIETVRGAGYRFTPAPAAAAT